MIDKHLDGILTYCDKKVPLGYIEGTNLKVRNIIRRSYGYRDKKYMKLKDNTGLFFHRNLSSLSISYYLIV